MAKKKVKNIVPAPLEFCGVKMRQVDGSSVGCLYQRGPLVVEVYREEVGGSGAHYVDVEIRLGSRTLYLSETEALDSDRAKQLAEKETLAFFKKLGKALGYEVTG